MPDITITTRPLPDGGGKSISAGPLPAPPGSSAPISLATQALASGIIASRQAGMYWEGVPPLSAHFLRTHDRTIGPNWSWHLALARSMETVAAAVETSIVTNRIANHSGENLIIDDKFIA